MILLASLLASILGLSSALGTTENVRATWIDRSQVANEADMRRIVESLHTLGVNRLYMDAWHNGVVYFPSPTMISAVGQQGVDDKKPLILWGAKYAHQYNISVYAWMQYGYIAGYKNGTAFLGYARRKGWVLEKPFMQHFWWMDPRTEATEFLGRISREAAATGADGIQVDDHFGCPNDYSLCSLAVVLDATQRFRKIIGNVTALSLSPWTMPYAKGTFFLDWPMLAKAGLFQEVVPQFYAMGIDEFNAQFRNNEKFLADYPTVRERHMVGISCQDDNGRLVPWQVIVNSLRTAYTHRYGVTIWHVDGILKTYYANFKAIWGKKTSDWE